MPNGNNGAFFRNDMYFKFHQPLRWLSRGTIVTKWRVGRKLTVWHALTEHGCDAEIGSEISIMSMGHKPVNCRFILAEIEHASGVTIPWQERWC